MALELCRFGTVVALDSQREAAERAFQRGIERVIQGDALRLPFPARTFHAACALDLVEHLEDDRTALREIHRVLENEGIVLVTAPAYRFLWGRQDVLNRHYRRYTLGELKRKVEEAGFFLERGTYFNTLLFPFILAVRLFLRPFLGRPVPRGRSDFDLWQGRLGNFLLQRVFSLEALLLKKLSFPFGVSVMALCRKKKA